MAIVHPTALIDPKAELAADVEVGPYCIVGPRVKIGAGTVLDAHVVVGGRTTIGRGNRFFPFSAIGGIPQDKKYGGEDTALVIGDYNTVREHCTFSLGTAQGGGVTRVGSDNWIMASVHVAHDCVVGDHTILANNVTLAPDSVTRAEEVKEYNPDWTELEKPLPKVGRNEPCPCGSGKKYKHCHGA
jgi:UDP-N-acetylglucosamine acyltransferase